MQSDFCVTFAAMNKILQQQAQWSENVILADADYIDKVAFNLTVNFERMIGRRIPQADMAKWLECVALDGGLRPPAAPPSPNTQVILIYGCEKVKLENFTPSSYKTELHGKAFKGELGEFVISAYECPDSRMGGEDFFIEALALAANQQEVKRLMVIPNADDPIIYNKVRETLRQTNGQKTTTVFAMQPMVGGTFQQEILGYSLMAALGIRADEIKP